MRALDQTMSLAGGNLKRQAIISVIIPTYNRIDFLRRCLDSIANQSFKNFEVIVIDGGSTDGTLHLLDKYEIRLIKQNSGELAHAYNLGILNSSGEILAFTDDDAVPDKDWLSNIARTFCSSGIIGAVGGYIANQNSTLSGMHTDMKRLEESGSPLLKLAAKIHRIIVLENKHEHIGKIMKSGATTGHDTLDQHPKILDVDFLGGCNMAYRKKAISEAGLFDENFVGHAAFYEADLCLRLKKLGYRIIFDPNVRVTHFGSRSGSPRGSFGTWRNFVYFYFKESTPVKFESFIRFLIYVFFLNMFWIHLFLTTGKTEYSESTKGIFAGFKAAISLPSR